MDTPGRYVIGIDLGTTNSAVAYIDTHDLLDGEVPDIRRFDIPQLVAEGVCEPRPTLPSFLYFTNAFERTAGHLGLPWEAHPACVVGMLARDQGALMPGRLVASAKSWLCHADVDRSARILPWGADTPDQACSPIEASTR